VFESAAAAGIAIPAIRNWLFRSGRHARPGTRWGTILACRRRNRVASMDATAAPVPCAVSRLPGLEPAAYGTATVTTPLVWKHRHSRCTV